MNYETEGWTWPVPIAPDGRLPQISDGFQLAGDSAKRGGAGHRGQDIMYRIGRLKKAQQPFPWSSKHYEMLPGMPALAANRGYIYRAGQLSSGWHVIIDHGDGLGTGYYHLSQLLPGVEAHASVNAAQPLGIIGGSPIGYGLVHLHFDAAIDGRFIDAAKVMRTWRHVPYEEAWGCLGRVGWTRRESNP